MPPALLAAAAAALVVLGMTINGVIAENVDPQLQAPVGMSASEQERVDKAAGASLLGQFRASMADFLWLSVDKYLHNGVNMRGMTDEEKRTGDADAVGNASSEAGSGNREHRGETTVIPSAGRDWRGVFGDLERQVQPYMDMSHHTHRDPKEALPLFRLMTWSNPHFIPGYVVGAAMIARDRAHRVQALNFLLEGETNNPDSIEIAEALGEMYTYQQRDFNAAMPYLTKAIAIGAARDRASMSDDETDAYENAYRWLVLNRRDHDPKAARAYALAGLKVFPTDIVCRRYMIMNPK
jgi:hypothetical protein